MPKQQLLIFLLACAMPLLSKAQETPANGHEHHKMTMDNDGVVMNENRSELPRNCAQISRDYQFTIHAGRDYASGPASTIYGMSEHEIQVEPCSRVEVTFVNEDSVRHQWMIHGLPKYLYPAGMFHIEVAGGKQKTGTLIVPGDDQTYLIHCDLSQHMARVGDWPNRGTYCSLPGRCRCKNKGWCCRRP